MKGHSGQVHRAPRRRRGHGLFSFIVLALLAVLPSTAAGASAAAGPETFLPALEDSGIAPGWRLRMGFLGTDNVTRDGEDGEEELIGVGEFGANWRYIGSRVAAAFDGTIAYRHYTQDTFDDEARANFLAAADWFVIPDTFDWYITDRLANAPIDPLGSTSPTNVQFINVLETGPRLTLRPGNANELTIAASGADVNAEESPIDHRRGTGTVSFMRALSTNSSIGLLANARRVDFEETAEGTDFEQGDAHLNFLTRSNTLNLSFAGGLSRVRMDDGFERDTGTGWIRAGLRRTSDSHLYFSVERRAGDAATAMLREELLLERGGVSEIIVAGDPFFADSATLRYTRGWRAHEWFIAASARDTDYFISPLDQEQRGGRIGIDLALSSRLRLSVSGATNDIEYLDLLRSDTIRLVDTEADYRIDRNWSLVSGLRWLERSSTDPAYAFDELMLTLFLSYSPRALRPQGRGN